MTIELTVERRRGLACLKRDGAERVLQRVNEHLGRVDRCKAVEQGPFRLAGRGLGAAPCGRCAAMLRGNRFARVPRVPSAACFESDKSVEPS